MPNQQIFTVDKFLGIDESADGLTELKMGQASRIENFYITDGYNLTLRPGIRRAAVPEGRTRSAMLAFWTGYIGSAEYLVTAELLDGQDAICIYAITGGSIEPVQTFPGLLGLSEPATVKIFPFADRVYVMGPGGIVSLAPDAGTVTARREEPYVPTVIVSADPQGGGTALENINLLSNKRIVEFNTDGEATAFTLPEEAIGIHSISFQGAPVLIDSAFTPETHTLAFTEPLPEGINMLSVCYYADPDLTAASFARLASMPYWEAYNGSTDTRLFFYGDGSNLTYYTGVERSGAPSALYIPAMNEIAVDASGSPITGMIRHYSKLMVFKPDGTFSISYSPMTLTDGSTIAGFYLRTVHKNLGHESPGQLQLVNNYPRAFSGGALYEWRVPSAYYSDERYAKCVSEPIVRSLAAADPAKIVTCDDNASGTYYIFLNNGTGTVLVNRYRQEVWTVYKSPYAQNIRFAACLSGVSVFASDTAVYYLDATAKYDPDDTPIPALWESGYMPYKADHLRKYANSIWVSMLPEASSKMTVTAATDRRDSYAEKVVGSNIFSWGAVDYAHWTYNLSRAPKIKRVKLKVKKFVYYKLIFRVDEPGARATVLGFDQQLRYAGLVK